MVVMEAHQQQAMLQPQGEQEPDSSELYATDNFRINFMKVLPCSKRYCHDWTVCPFAHPGEKARRRDPRATSYTGIACPDMKKDGVCARGELCPYAHNVFEYWLHPTRYRTQLCNDGTSCKRRVCFFAHTLPELRVPESKPFVNPQALAAAGAAAGARRSGQAMEPQGSNMARASRGFADVNGATELANRLALLQLRQESGASTQSQMASAMSAAQQQQQQPLQRPAQSEGQNAQLMQLLSALLAQKQQQQESSLQFTQLSQATNEQLAALNQPMGPVLASEQLPCAADLASVYTVEQLAQLQLQMEARCKRASSEHTRPTPRSSLDLSRLQVCAPSDYTASGRSSFETQARASQDGRRYSLDSSQRPDFGSLLSAGHGSLDSNPSGRTSLEAACPPRMSVDSSAPRLSSEAIANLLQVSGNAQLGTQVPAAITSPFEQARAPAPPADFSGAFDPLKAPMHSNNLPDPINERLSNSNNFDACRWAQQGNGQLGSIGAPAWNEFGAVSSHIDAVNDFNTFNSRSTSMPVTFPGQTSYVQSNRYGSGSVRQMYDGVPFESVRSGNERFPTMPPHVLPTIPSAEAVLPPLPPSCRASIDSLLSQAPRDTVPHLMGALAGTEAASVVATCNNPPRASDSLFTHAPLQASSTSQVKYTEGAAFSGTSCLGALYEPSNKSAVVSRAPSSNEDQN